MQNVEKNCTVIIDKPEAMNPKRVGDFMDNGRSKMHVQHHCQIDQSSQIKDTFSTTAYDGHMIITVIHVS